MKKQLVTFAAGAATAHIAGNLALATLAATGGSVTSFGFLVTKSLKFMATPPAVNVIKLMDKAAQLSREQEVRRTTATRVG